MTPGQLAKARRAGYVTEGKYAVFSWIMYAIGVGTGIGLAVVFGA